MNAARNCVVVYLLPEQLENEQLTLEEHIRQQQSQVENFIKDTAQMELVGKFYQVVKKQQI